MLTARQIIEQVAKDKELRSLCGKLSPNLKDDLFQELMVILLEYDPQKIELIYKENRLRFFVVKILMNQACSSTSPFFKMYRDRHETQDYDKILPDNSYRASIINNYDPFVWMTNMMDGSTDHSEIKDFIIEHAPTIIDSYSKQNDNNWYRTELFMQYIKEGSIRKLSKKTGIPPMSINRSLIEFKKEIKQKINEHTFNTSE